MKVQYPLWSLFLGGGGGRGVSLGFIGFRGLEDLGFMV